MIAVRYTESIPDTSKQPSGLIWNINNRHRQINTKEDFKQLLEDLKLEQREQG